MARAALVPINVATLSAPPVVGGGGGGLSDLAPGGAASHANSTFVGVAVLIDHPDQRALPITELADAVYGYSFIVTNLDVSTPDKATGMEHWYRHRTQIESIFRDAKLGAALRRLPSGYPQVNKAWT